MIWKQSAEKKAAQGINKHFHLNAAADAWPTPTSRDHKDGADPSETVESNALLGRVAPRWDCPPSPPVPPTGTAGPGSSPAGPDSRPLWQTPSDPSFKYRRQVGQTERAEKLLPAQAEDANWATPNAGDAVGTHGGGQGRSLRTDIAKMGKKRLNPEFVDWLMGLSPGWTDSAPLETASSRLRLKQLSENYSDGSTT